MATKNCVVCVCGQLRFHLNELAGALNELGYEPLRRKKPAGGRTKYDDDRPTA